MRNYIRRCVYISFFVCVVIGGFYGLLKFRFNPPQEVENSVEVKLLGNYKIIALNNETALVKCLASKKLKKVLYQDIKGEIRLGAIVNIPL